MRASIIKNGIVINVIELPENWPNVKDAFVAPEGTEIVATEKANIGEGYDRKAKPDKRFFKVEKEDPEVAEDTTEK
jgi:hypothetical protein